MTRSMDEFIGRLERDLDHWRADLIKFQAVGEKVISQQLTEWIAEAERIILEYRRNN